VGLFKKIKKFAKSTVKKVTHPVATVKKVAANPARYTEGVLSGGLTEVIRKLPVVGNIYSGAFDKLYAPLYDQAANYYTYGLSGQVQSQLQGDNPMAFKVGNFLSAVGGTPQGVQGKNAGGVRAVGAITSVLGAGFTKQPTGRPLGVATTQAQGIRTMAAAGPVMRSGAVVARGFFNRFPNLALAMQAYRTAGKKVTRGKLYSLVRRFGPEIVISGGLLTAAAVNELLIAGPGTRRMNPANTKALRRSMRRVESFHKLCQRSDMLRSRGRKKVCR
jgi:hypothetical protein